MSKRLSALLAAGVLAGSLPLSLYALSSAEIEDDGESKYKSVCLSPEVYAGAQADLSDLRLYDSAGEIVPYFIRSEHLTHTEQTSRTPLTQIDSFQKKELYYYDFVAEQQDLLSDLLATSILLQTPSQPFAKEVDLFGSHDGLNWELICRETIYRVDEQEQLEITFPAPQKFTHYRLALINQIEPIDLVGAVLNQRIQNNSLTPLRKQLTPSFTVSQEDSNTKIELSGLRHLRLTELSLETDSMFRRPVRALGTEEMLYQLEFSQVAYADTTLALGGHPLDSDTLTVFIQNGDDKPLSIQRITVFYAADELVFAGTTGPYHLTFGEPLSPPRYDIEGYREQVLSETIDPLSIISIRQAPLPEQASSETDWQLIFNIVVVVIAVLLGIVILLRIQKTEKK